MHVYSYNIPIEPYCGISGFNCETQYSTLEGAYRSLFNTSVPVLKDGKHGKYFDFDGRRYVTNVRDGECSESIPKCKYGTFEEWTDIFGGTYNIGCEPIIKSKQYSPYYTYEIKWKNPELICWIKGKRRFERANVESIILYKNTKDSRCRVHDYTDELDKIPIEILCVFLI